MKAIVVTDQAAGTAGMTLVERPEPQAEHQAFRAASLGVVPAKVVDTGEPPVTVKG